MCVLAVTGVVRGGGEELGLMRVGGHFFSCAGSSFFAGNGLYVG